MERRWLPLRLSFYVGGAWLRAFLGSVFFFSLLFVVVVLSQELAWFIQISPRHRFIEFVAFFAWWIPYWLIYTYPISAMYATTFVLGKLSADQELVGAYNAGIPLDRLLWPVYLMVALCSGVLFVFDREIIYEPFHRHLVVVEDLRGNRLEDGPAVRQNVSVFGAGNKLYFIDRWHQTNHRMENAHILYFDAKMSFRRLVSARTVTYDGVRGAWIGEGVVEREFPSNQDAPTVRADSNRILALEELPYHFHEGNERDDLMSARDSKRLAEKYEVIGGNARHWWLQYWSKTATPFMALFIVFFGVPLSTFSRKNTLVLSLFLVLLAYFAYYVLQQVGVSLGTWGVLPGPLAGWFGNFLFLGGGFALRRTLLQN